MFLQDVFSTVAKSSDHEHPARIGRDEWQPMRRKPVQRRRSAIEGIEFFEQGERRLVQQRRIKSQLHEKGLKTNHRGTMLDYCSDDSMQSSCGSATSEDDPRMRRRRNRRMSMPLHQQSAVMGIDETSRMRDCTNYYGSTESYLRRNTVGNASDDGDDMNESSTSFRTVDEGPPSLRNDGSISSSMRSTSTDARRNGSVGSGFFRQQTSSIRSSTASMTNDGPVQFDPTVRQEAERGAEPVTDAEEDVSFLLSHINGMLQRMENEHPERRHSDAILCEANTKDKSKDGLNESNATV